MSLSAQENGAYPQISSGKTPPPAPSAAFAKRYATTFIYHFIQYGQSS